jgi:hypothetical protein
VVCFLEQKALRFMNRSAFCSVAPGVVPEQVNVTVRVLSRVGIFSWARSALIADFTPRLVPQGCYAIAHLRDLGPTRIGDDAGRTQVVAKDVEQLSSLSHIVPMSFGIAIRCVPA